MSKVPFIYYLHDNYEHDEMVDWFISQGIDRQIAEQIAETRPFYEIKIECEFDTETGRTEYQKVSST